MRIDLLIFTQNEAGKIYLDIHVHVQGVSMVTKVILELENYGKKLYIFSVMN